LRAVNPFRAIALGLALLSVVNVQAGTLNNANTTLGVTVTLPGGGVDRFAVENATTHKLAPMIPLKGTNGVYGVRVEPYISDGLIAVRLSAVLGGSSAQAEGSCLQKSGPVKSIEIGSYVIGKQGDYLQIADLEKFGLQPLTITAATVSIIPVSSGDPCCFTSDGLECCWSCSGCKTQSCFDACQQQEAECLSVCN
jgi:hypothetical protein